MAHPKLFAAALSALTKARIVSFQDYLLRQKEGLADGDEPLDLLSLHSSNLCTGDVASDTPIVTKRARAPNGKPMLVKVQTLSGPSFLVGCDEWDSVLSFKQELATASAGQFPVPEQKLVFSGKVLAKDDLLLTDYNVLAGSVIHLSKLSSVYYVPEDFRDPTFDFDYTLDVNYVLTFKNGVHFHRKPCGWMRFGLNVTNLFDDNIDWLGGGRNKGMPMGVNEWPVSYHGTGLDKDRSAAQDGYRFCKQEGKKVPKRRHRYRRQVPPQVWSLFDFGVYTTPDVIIAENHAPKFNYEGEEYKALFQDRINPLVGDNFKMYPTIRPNAVEYWINKNEEDVRPYGIMIKKVQRK